MVNNYTQKRGRETETKVTKWETSFGRLTSCSS